MQSSNYRFVILNHPKWVNYGVKLVFIMIFFAKIYVYNVLNVDGLKTECWLAIINLAPKGDLWFFGIQYGV